MFVGRLFYSLALALFVACATDAAAAATPPLPAVDRIVVIVLENQEAASILSASPDASRTPRLDRLAHANGIAANYFGIAHPSLPNYIALIAGDTFGIADDRGSCFTRTLKRHCHRFGARNLVDELEKKHISWTALMQSMPRAAFLGGGYFFSTTYAEKHNPFVYFSDIATNAQRMAHIVPLESVDAVRTLLSDGKTAPRFLFIVPDLCHDMHGAPQCLDRDDMYAQSDAFVSDLVSAIQHSAAFTNRSAIFITWDEGTSNAACCDLQSGGGRVAAIVVGKHGAPRRSNAAYNHYSLLNTIETVWGLGRVGHTGERNTNGKPRFAPILDLLPR